MDPGVAQTSWLRCEKINNLTQRRQGAKTRKEQLLCFLRAFYDFAALREMLLLIQRLFHSLKNDSCATPRDDFGVLNECPKWVATSQRQSAEPLS
jgi:hypothetical protein